MTLAIAKKPGENAVDVATHLIKRVEQLKGSVIPEGVERTFMGWFTPGRNTFSQSNVMLSSLFRHRKEEFGMTTGLNGGLRAMVPFGNFEDIMPLDILPTQLLEQTPHLGRHGLLQAVALHADARSLDWVVHLVADDPNVGAG